MIEIWIIAAIAFLALALVIIPKDDDEKWDEEELRNIMEARRLEREREDEEQIKYLEEYKKAKEEKNARKLHRKLRSGKGDRKYPEEKESED